MLKRIMTTSEFAITRNEELHEIVQRLAFAAEYKNTDGAAHLQRIGYYTELLAKASGLPARDCALIRAASPLHDIGKVGIPEHILLKPGKLTPEEWEVMKTHTTIGAGLLSHATSPLLRMGKVIARSHHERWDGTGYPDGLQGEEAPIAARIMAIADVFDALTTDRPYEKAWPLAEAVEVISSGRELQFDPQLVEVFTTILPQFLRVRHYFSETKLASDTETFGSDTANAAH